MANDRLFVSLLGSPGVRVAVPRDGAIAIGRGRDCDLRVDDPLVSRRHAIVHGGDPAQFEELGSKNSSVLLRAPRAEPIGPSRRIAIASGDVIQVGSRLVGIHHGGPAFVAMLPDSDAFEAQLATACRHPPHDGQALAVIRIQLARRTQPELAQAALYALVSAVRGAVHSVLGPYEMSLLVRMAPEALPLELSHLATQLGELEMQGDIGIAVHPRDGSTAMDLLAAASESLETIRAGAGPSGAAGAPSTTARIRELERELGHLRAAQHDSMGIASTALDEALGVRGSSPGTTAPSLGSLAPSPGTTAPSLGSLAPPMGTLGSVVPSRGSVPGAMGRLVVGRGARQLVLPSGERVDLSRHASLRRIVLVLAGRHRAGVSAGLSTDELFAHGWPGERVDAFSGGARVRVALSRLRSLGLRDVLVRGDDGYVLDPEIAVDVEAEPARPPS